MTRIHWIGLAAVVGLGAATLYGADRTNALEARLLVQEGAIDDAEARLAEAVAERARLAEAVERLGSAEAIARSVLDARFEDVTAAVAEALAADPEAVARLTGPVGPAPDVEEMTALLLDRGLTEVVGRRIWEERHRELATMPEVVAEIAAVVYETYGNELRGEDGRSVNIEDLARFLAADPTFAALLEVSKN